MSKPAAAGSDFAQLQREIIKILPDSRPYMKAAYSVFAGEKQPDELDKFVQAAAEAGGGDKGGGRGGLFGKRGGGGRGLQSAFYADMYLGLLAEAQGQSETARERMVAAARSEYGQESGDYMWHLSKVHCQRRGWQF
jgi:hypothetical protein